MSRSIASTSRLIRRHHPALRTLPERCHARAFGVQARLHQSSQFPSSMPEGRQPLSRVDPVIEAAKKRRNLAAMGLVFSVACTLGLIALWPVDPKEVQNLRNKVDKSDAGGRPFPGDPAEDEKTRNLRQTGTSSVPFFPKTINLPRDKPVSTATPALPAGTSLPGAPTASSNDEFSLLGLGIRTVSFLSIQVYVVGLYIATTDLPVLQAAMIRAGADVETASTLVANEKKALKERLLDAEGGIAVWDNILKEAGIRSVVRIVPTRGTDYAHLRDGWVRGIMARSGNAGTGWGGEKFDDDAFGEAVGEFKKMFGAKKLPKGKVMMLERRKDGRLVGWEQAGSDQDFAKMGEIRDERLGRLIWMGYLAGKNVSSEGARKDIVDGIEELVERPVGTVETQVV